MAPAPFAAFWGVYPRKKAKRRAEAVWQRLKPDTALLAVMLESLGRDERSEQWRRGVIPHAATWLNQRRWEDEPDGARVIDEAGNTVAFEPPPRRRNGRDDIPSPEQRARDILAEIEAEAEARHGR